MLQTQAGLSRYIRIDTVGNLTSYVTLSIEIIWMVFILLSLMHKHAAKVVDNQLSVSLGDNTDGRS